MKSIERWKIRDIFTEKYLIGLKKNPLSIVRKKEFTFLLRGRKSPVCSELFV